MSRWQTHNKISHRCHIFLFFRIFEAHGLTDEAGQSFLEEAMKYDLAFNVVQDGKLGRRAYIASGNFYGISMRRMENFGRSVESVISRLDHGT